MGLFDFLKPVENDIGGAAKGTFGFLNNLKTSLVNAGKDTLDIGSALEQGVQGLANVGAQSVFGSDQSYQKAISTTNKAVDYSLNASRGTITPQEAANADLYGNSSQRMAFLKPVVRNVVAYGPYALAPETSGITAGLLPETAGTLAKLVVGAATNFVTNTGLNVAGQAVQGQHINLGQAAKNALPATAFSTALEAAPEAFKGVKSLNEATKANIDVQASKTSGLDPKNIVNGNEMGTLKDFASYKMGDYKPSDTNVLIRQARNAAQTAGIDVTSGSPADVASRIEDYTSKWNQHTQAANAIAQGGYVRIGGAETPVEPPKPSDINIPVGDGILKVTAQDMQDLSNATSADQVKKIIGNALPQGITNKVAPAIAQTKDPHIIANIFNKATPNPTRDISQIPEGQTVQPTLADIQQADVNGRSNANIQTQIEQAHNAGDNAKVADLVKQLPAEDQPSMRSALGIQDTGSTSLSPETQAAVDRATNPTEISSVDINPSGKVKQLSGDIRTAYSGEKNAQIQAASTLSDTLKKLAPNEQDAITWYREAKGNVATLQDWLNRPNLAAYKEDIQNAMDLSPQAKEVSAALDEVYAKAGKNAYEKGTLNNVLSDYDNPRVYQKPDKQPNTVGGVLKQTTASANHRVFENLPEAIDNGHFPATTNAADLANIHLSDFARANATNSLLKGLADSKLATTLREGDAVPEGFKVVGNLRAIARDEKNQRIDLYSMVKDLRPVQSKAERLITTRNSWVRDLTSQINRLNKQGLDVSLSKTSDAAEGGNAFKYLQKDVLTNAETTAKSRGIQDIGPAQSVTGQLKTILTPGKGASVSETRSLINDLVNLPDGKIEAIKGKIATRENKLGPILDNISELKNQVDDIKLQRQGILDTAKGINSPTRVAVPEELAKGLRAITEPDFVRRIDGYRSIAAYQGLVKTVDLSFSFFHHITEAAQLLYQTKGGIDLLRQGNKIMHSVDSPEFADMENNFVKYGGITTKVADVQDVMRNLIGSDKSTYSKITNLPVAKQVLGVAEKSSSLLFDHAQRWVKVSDFQGKMQNWITKHPDATPADFTSAAQGYAKEINAAYGGLNWEAMGVSKTAQSVMRGVLLAPDWVVSNLALGKYALTKGFSDTAGNAARAHLITAFSTGFAATEVLNKSITGHFTNQNPKGHKWEVEIAPNVYVSIFRGGIGDMLKIASDIQDKGIAQGTAQYAQGKLSPIARTVIGLMSGSQFTGQPITNKNGSFAQKTVDEAKYLATSALPVPFGVSAGAKYVSDAVKTKQPVNPLVAATLGVGISRFNKSSNGLSNKQQAYISQLAKGGASKQEQDANVQFYLTLKKTASDRTKADTAITNALARNDVQGALKAAADYNQKLAGSFKGWNDSYGKFANDTLQKAYSSNKIKLTTSSINARIKSIRNNPLYSATTGGQ